MAIKRALVCGAGGFIGHNLVKRLKSEGWYVVGLDLKFPSFEKSEADEFVLSDATGRRSNMDLFRNGMSPCFIKDFDRVYQLAADMGGAGFVFTGDNDAQILTNSLGINLNVLNEARTQGFKGQIFYSSSVCAYPDEVEGVEGDAYPANPPSNYGWEKLTSERLYLAYAKNFGIDVRIARFHNCFGPYGTYDGGREKSPAAICRKVLQADKEIEVWGNGEQLRPFIFIEDLLDGIEALMLSDYKEPVNLGPSEGVTINQMIDIVCEIAHKWPLRKYIPGPTGGQTRNANNDLAKRVLKWSPKRDFKGSLEITYNWIKSCLDQK